ncbi:MAG: DUF2339 domain-containing protein [Bacteroidetes bacterium]|nr:DUF2339 domain-containing protein [Bacteroidota bacterium]
MEANSHNQLLQQLEQLVRKQEALRQEVELLRTQILQQTAPAAPPAATAAAPKPQPAQSSPPSAPQQAPAAVPTTRQWQEVPKAAPAPEPVPMPTRTKSDLEKFIGENLINKIGIAILVIGVAIGAKYAIDNELISPLTRIILGYLAGLGLMGTAIYLKPSYENFSAVLLSGAMAILYFITFAAYSFYELFPQAVAFVLMLLFTCFTVVAALQYNQQVIAHIGLVGAYAVPFLLSDGSGRVEILFSYMSIINGGILVIAFKRYWKRLYYVAFGLSWLIFLAWYGFQHSPDHPFILGFGFATLFFALFYLTFLAYKLKRKEAFGQSDVLLLLANSFIYFGLGYSMLDSYPHYDQFLGLFTLMNALAHLSVCVVVYRTKLADSNLFYLLAGLVLLFITIAVPIQLDGNWVTLVWTGEACLLFWIGRSRQVKLYEELSLPLMLLAFLSLVHDWYAYYPMHNHGGISANYRPLFNITFFTSLLFAGAFAFMNWLGLRTPSTLDPKRHFTQLQQHGMALLLLVGLYFAFALEIHTYWIATYQASAISIPEAAAGYRYYRYNLSLLHYKTLWILLYSCLFLTALLQFNLRRLRSLPLAWLSLGLSGLALLAFLSNGLEALSQLRMAWLQPENPQYFPQGMGNLLIRYLAVGLLGLLLWSAYQQQRRNTELTQFRVVFELVLGITILWVASDELMHWMSLQGFSQSNKLGLSILWGVYALLVIVLGMRLQKKHLRLAAFGLFGITLVKLFLYDLSHLNTIGKTIVLVSLGVLLLVISFLYNKHKHLINDTPHE